MKPGGILLTVFVWLMLSLPVRSAETAQREFTCPLDDHKFVSTTVTSRNKTGGTDSDFCSYEHGTQALPFEVHTCPMCGFSASTTELEQRLSPELIKKVQEALGKWKDANKMTDWSKVSPSQQYELAAVCGFVKFANSVHAGTLYARAAWCARMEAVSKVSAERDLGQPVSAVEAAEMIRARVKNQTDAAKQTQMRFELAQVCDRAGMGSQRDELLATLDAAPPSDPSYARFKELVRTEKRNLKQAADCYVKAIGSGEIETQETGLYLYLIGDLNRRMGQDAVALEYYQKAQKAEGLRPDIKELADFLISTLKPAKTPAQEK